MKQEVGDFELSAVGKKCLVEKMVGILLNMES